MPEDLRAQAYRQCREVLWALDAAWAKKKGMATVTSFLRYFGGPLQLCMRRYRFVEEDLTVGKQEDVGVVEQTRNHYKLWNRIDRCEGEANMPRYEGILAKSEELLFPGLANFIKTGGDGHCEACVTKASYGAETVHRFGGVELCEKCKPQWREYLVSFPERAAKTFPELVPVYKAAIVDVDVPEVPAAKTTLDEKMATTVHVSSIPLAMV